MLGVLLSDWERDAELTARHDLALAPSPDAGVSRAAPVSEETQMRAQALMARAVAW